jgi:hypothetical protein
MATGSCYVVARWRNAQRERPTWAALLSYLLVALRHQANLARWGHLKTWTLRLGRLLSLGQTLFITAGPPRHFTLSRLLAASRAVRRSKARWRDRR